MRYQLATAHCGGSRTWRTTGVCPCLHQLSPAELGLVPSQLPPHSPWLPSSVSRHLPGNTAGKEPGRVNKGFCNPICGITHTLLMPICSNRSMPQPPKQQCLWWGQSYPCPHYSTEESIILAQALASGQGIMWTDEKQCSHARDLANFIPGAMALELAALHLWP